MITFDRELEYECLREREATDLSYAGWYNARVRYFGTNWIVVTAAFHYDDSRCWYIYERIAEDNWVYRSFGEVKHGITS